MTLVSLGVKMQANNNRQHPPSAPNCYLLSRTCECGYQNSLFTYADSGFKIYGYRY